MALPPAVAAAAFVSALGSIRGNPGGADPNAIARTLRAKYSSDPPQSFLTYLNIVRQAIRAATAANAQNVNPAHGVPGYDLPKVPSTAANGDAFEYRIVVIADPGDGSEPFRTAVTISSNRPLSDNELLQKGLDAYAGQSFERDYRNQVQGVGSSPAISIEVISAGRTT